MTGRRLALDCTRGRTHRSRRRAPPPTNRWPETLWGVGGGGGGSASGDPQSRGSFEGRGGGGVQGRQGWPPAVLSVQRRRRQSLVETDWRQRRQRSRPKQPPQPPPPPPNTQPQPHAPLQHPTGPAPPPTHTPNHPKAPRRPGTPRNNNHSKPNTTPTHQPTNPQGAPHPQPPPIRARRKNWLNI